MHNTVHYNWCGREQALRSLRYKGCFSKRVINGVLTADMLQCQTDDWSEAGFSERAQGTERGL